MTDKVEIVVKVTETQADDLYWPGCFAGLGVGLWLGTSNEFAKEHPVGAWAIAAAIAGAWFGLAWCWRRIREVRQ